MDCGNFLQLELCKENRLVWAAGPEKPAEATAQAPAAPVEAKPSNPEAAKEEGKKRAETAQSGLPNVPAADEQLKEDLKTTEKPAYTKKQITETSKKYKDSETYKAFLADPKNEDKKTAFLDSVSAEDKEIIEYAITAEPTEEEKKGMAERFKDKIPLTEEEVRKKVADGELNLREERILDALIMANREAKESSAIPESVKGIGFIAILERLMEKFTKLFEKLGAQLTRLFKKKETAEQPQERFAKSPLGEQDDQQKKFEIAKVYEANEGIKFKAKKDAELFAVEAGELKNLPNNRAEITTADHRKITYSNIVLDTPVPTQITAGAKIGKTGPGDNFGLTYNDAQGKEQDPQPLLANFITEEAPAAPKAQAAAPPVPQAKPSQTKT